MHDITQLISNGSCDPTFIGICRGLNLVSLETMRVPIVSQPQHSRRFIKAIDEIRRKHNPALDQGFTIDGPYTSNRQHHLRDGTAVRRRLGRSADSELRSVASESSFAMVADPVRSAGFPGS
jgi:hypothetical protein